MSINLIIPDLPRLCQPNTPNINPRKIRKPARSIRRPLVTNVITKQHLKIRTKIVFENSSNDLF